MKCQFSLDIDAPIARVFDLIQDPEKHKLWLQGVEETRYVGAYDPANPVGTKFKQKIREGGKVKEYDGEVTAFARPRHIGIRLFAAQFTVQVDYLLTPAEQLADGTHLDYTADIACGSWFLRLLARAFALLMRAMLKKQLRQLKKLAEAGN